MTDKEKIRKEVERLMTELIQEKEKGYGSDADNACILELQNVLTYIDSLQEETVSNDLEEAAKNVGQKYFPDEDNIWARPNYEAVKAECAFMDGAKWQKEQLMKDAVYGLVCGHDESSPAWIDLNLLNKPNVKVGTEVKLIIIKDE